MTPIKYLLTSVAFAFVPLYYTAATKGEAIDAQVKRRQAIEQFQEAVNVMTAGFDTDGDGRVTRKDADVNGFLRKVAALPNFDWAYPITIDEELATLWKKTGRKNKYLKIIPRAESGGFVGGSFNSQRYYRPYSIVLTNELVKVKVEKKEWEYKSE